MSRKLALTALSLALLAAGTPEAFAADQHVATLVVIKTPEGVTRAKLEAGFAASVPTYQKIPGLIRKYYTVNGDGFGGIYLWKDRAAAEAWFTAAWAAQCKQRNGTECQLTWFDTPLQIDGQAAGD
ncbi:hypothetical protein JQ625_00505 [Bradyrhizobium diazoefficiens]|nr:hypothetical protein [Bradyrhizobium diazoefficiens]MBR0773299.1 hypothetical protein [Bradyrhizobium diazoefficiens]